MDLIKTFAEQHSFRQLYSLQRLAEPLRVHYGITTFWHYRIDEQGTFFYTGNDPQAMNQFLELNLHRENPFFAHPKLFPAVSLIGDIVDAKAYQKVRDALHSKMNLCNHYLILKKPSPDVCEGFGFASSLPDNCIHEAVLQSPQIFESFIDYYLENTQKMRDSLFENRVSIHQVRGGAFLQKADLHKRLALLQEK